MSSNISVSSFDPKKSPLTTLSVKQSPAKNSKVTKVFNGHVPKKGEVNSEKELPFIEHCPMSDEEILTESLLDTLKMDQIPPLWIGESDKTQKEVILKLAANFLGGGLITKEGGQLDGFKFLPNLRAWEWLLTNISSSMKGENSPEKIVLDALLNKICQLMEYEIDLEIFREDEAKNKDIDLAKLALTYAKKIQNLKPGESQMLSGGWSNSFGKGHALIYEFKRNTDGTYDIYLYTSTGFQLADTRLESDKQRIKPIIRYSGVPEAQILFNRDGHLWPVFIQHFIENQVLTLWEREHVVDEEDVLEIFDHLAKYQVEVAWDELGAITGQRGGTCVVSATKVWVRFFCQHLGRYKQLMLHVNLRLIIALYHEFKADLSADAKEGALKRRLLEEVGRNYLRSIVKGVEGTHGFGPLADEKLAHKSQATIYHLLKEIRRHEIAIAKERAEEQVLCDFSEFYTEEQRYLRRKNEGVPKRKEVQKQTANAQDFPDLKSKIDSPKQLHASVEKLFSLSKNTELLHLNIHHIVDQLPLPTPPSEVKGKKQWIIQVKASYWENLSEKELEVALVDMQALASFYAQGPSTDDPTRCHATLFSLHAISHYLSLKIEASKKLKNEKANLCNYQILEFWKLPNILEGLVYFDRQGYLRIQEAIQYFKKFNAQAKYAPLFDSEEYTHVNRYTVTEDEEEKIRGQFWEALVSESEDLKTTLKKSVSFDLWNEQYNQAKRGYCQKMERYKDSFARYESKKEQYLKKLKLYEEKDSGRKPKKPSPPEEPSDPIKPSSNTFYTLLLESDLLASESLLCESGFGYVFYFRLMSFFANQGTKQQSFNLSFDTSSNFFYSRRMKQTCFKPLVRTLLFYNPYSFEQTVEKYNQGISKSSIEQQESVFEKQHRQISKDHQRFFKAPITQRDMEKWDRQVAEAETLKAVKGRKQTLFDKLLRASTEWKLTPYQLMLELRENLDTLNDPSFQALIFRLFFRSPVDLKEKAHLGVGELILEDDALLKNCTQFINNGLLHFYQAKNKEGIKGARFFLELSFYLSKYLSDAGEYDKAQELETVTFIDRWLAEKELKPEVAAILHQYRLLLESLKPKRDVLRIYQSWIFSQFYPDDGIWKSPMLQSIASDAIAKLTVDISEDLKNNKEFRNKLGTGIFSFLPLGEKETDLAWKYDKDAFNLLTVELKNQGIWEIDLLTGSVFSPHGEVGHTDKKHSWERDRDFIHLFENAKYEYLALGGGKYCFQHPQMGTVRLIRDSSVQYKKYVIQRQFFNLPGVWFEYQSEDSQFGYSDIFFSDYAFWAPVNKTVEIAKDVSILGYFASLNDQKPYFATDANGLILEVNPETGGISQKMCCVDLLSWGFECGSKENYVKALSRFDPLYNILYYQEPEKGNPQDKIVFPRYTLQFFISKEGKACWSEDSQYVIQGQMQTGDLGTIANCISLEHINKKGPRKLLIPFQPIQSKSTPIPYGELDIKNEKPIMSSAQDLNSRGQWGKFQYFVFNVINGKVKPTTIEGRLFLAYIYFSQKKYAQAIKLIRSLKPTEILSEMSMEILEMLLESPLGEDHPDAKMVHMHALLSRMEQMDKMSSEPIKNYIESAEQILQMIESMSEYLCSLNNISSRCQLTNEEEKELISKVVKEAKRKDAAIKKIDKKGIFDHCISILDHRLQYLGNAKHGQRGIDYGKGGRIFPPSEPKRLRHPVCFYDELEKELGLNKWYPRTICWDKEKDFFALVTRPHSKGKIEGNGWMLVEVLKIAKSESQEAKRAMLYRLKQWRIHSKSESALPYFDLMIAMLCYPQYFPEPIDPFKVKDSQKKEFLNQLNSAFGKICISRKGCDPIINRLLHVPSSKHQSQPFPKGKYPIPKKEIFDLAEKHVESISHDFCPLKIKIEENTQRWSQLNQWKKKFFKEKKEMSSHSYKDFNLKYNSSLLTEEEEDYAPTLKKDLELLMKDYDAGKAENEKEILWEISHENCSELLKEVEGKKNHIEKLIDEKKEVLLKKVNVKASNPLLRQAECARIGGSVDKPLTYTDCVNLLLSMDQREYQLKNPHLKQSAIEEIAHLTLEIEDLKSYHAQFLRLCDLCKKIKGIEDPQDLTRLSLCQQLYTNLDGQYYFDKFNVEIQVALHVFAGETGILPYQKQIHLIEKMLETEEKDPTRFKSIVGQLIMGGGKTSVIATIILYLAAKRSDRLALFIMPSSLFKTVESNFSDGMLQAFHKRVQSIDVSREDFSLIKLEQIEKQLARAKENHEPIVMKETTLQVFGLGFLSQVRDLKKMLREKRALKEESRKNLSRICELRNKVRYAHGQEACKLNNELKEREKVTFGQLYRAKKNKQEQIEEYKSKVRILARLCKQFSKNADALLDEVDLLLYCLHEVNFPDGDTIPIDPTTNSLILYIFKVLVSKDIKIDALKNSPAIADVVRLHKNEQSLMDSQTYHQYVTPIIAKQLAETFKPIKDYIGTFQESFIRYASGKMPTILQQFADDDTFKISENTLSQHMPDWEQYGTLLQIQKDVNFIKYLKTLFTSGKKDQKEAANLMALTGHILNEVLLSPSGKSGTLTKSGLRHYGPSHVSDSSTEMECLDLVPYLALHTPASTMFGYHIEKACYFYQWVAAFSIQEKDILQMALMAEESAKYYMEKNGEEKFEETVEYQEFFRLFGVTLDEIKDPKNLKKAAEAISKDLDKQLEIAYEMVAQRTTLRAERLSSNGMNLISQLDTARTMSGTPYNWQGFLKRLVDRVNLDSGTEGRIFHTMAKRAQSTPVHEVDFSTMEEFLDQVLKNHPQPHKIRGIIETGGIFSQFTDNADVAKKIMAYITKHKKRGGFGEGIEGVLFFHKDPGQKQADTLYVWREGADHPERIGGTSPAVLEAKGLDPSKYFVYYDERHTTGVDIKQEPEAINLMTFDKKMIRRIVGQGGMRLRQFLFSQNVEFVVTKETRATLVNQGKTVEDFVLTAEKNQSIQKTEHMVRYFRQQIDNIFRQQAVQSLIELVLTSYDEKAFEEMVEWAEPFFVKKMGDDPYLLHGRLKQKVDTKEMLLRYLEFKLELFKRLVKDLKIVAQVEKEAKSLEEHIRKTDALPAKWKDGASDIGVELEQDVEMQSDVAAAVNTEVETEIDMELKRYEEMPRESLLKEKDMKEQEFVTLIKTIKDKISSGGKVIPLQEQLSKFKYGLNRESHPYQKAFQEPIYGTHAYFYSVNTTLPVFHPLQKPPKQILAVRVGNKMHWVLLSEHEANAARRHLLHLYQKKSPAVEGVWLVQPDGSLLVNTEENEEFPEEEEAVARGLLEINAFGGNIGYLDKHSFECEPWLTTSETALKISFLKLRAARDEKNNEILRCNLLIQKEDKTFAHHPNHHVFKLRADKEKNYRGKLIPQSPAHAKILSAAKVKDLRIEYVKYLGIDWEKRETDPHTKEAIGKLKEPTKKNVQELTRKQFEYLQPYQIPFLTTDQMKWLPPSKVKYLEHPHQIYNEDKENRYYFLSLEQVKALDETQAQLIPYVYPKFYKEFEHPWQIQAVTVEHLKELDQDQWIHLKKEQLKKIPHERADDLKHFPDPQKLSWVHGDLLDKIPKQYLFYVCAEQIREISDPTLIKNLETLASSNTGGIQITKGQWTSWIAPSMVVHIDFSTQLQYLKDKPQIKKVPDEYIPDLNPKDQVPQIDSSQAKCLKGIDQIRACPFVYVSDLEIEQLKDISNDQIPYLRENKQVQTLKDQERFEHLKSTQMQWISTDQLSLVQLKHVKGLSNNQLLELKNRHSNWVAVQKGITQKQISSFDSEELFDLLNKTQIKNYLGETQVQYLKKDWQVQACPVKLVKKLDDLQVPEILPDKVEGLSNPQLLKLNEHYSEPEKWQPYQEKITEDQIKTFDSQKMIDLLNKTQIENYLGETQVQYLKKDWQVQACPVKLMKKLDDLQVPKILPDKVEGLSNPQLLKLNEHYSDPEKWQPYQEKIPEDQIKTFDSQKLIDLLNKTQIENHLGETQVRYLKKDWQVQACPVKLVKKLDDLQVPEILPDKVEGLSNPQLLKLNEHYSDPEKWQPYQEKIPEDQIKTFDSQKLIDLLNKTQIENHLGETQVRYLKKDWQIQACPDGLVKKLDRLQTPDISLDQVQHIKMSQVQYLKDLEKIRKVRPELYPGLIKEQVEKLEKRDLTIINQLTTNQLGWLTPEKAAWITDSNVIDRLPDPLRKSLKRKWLQFKEGHINYKNCLRITAIVSVFIIALVGSGALMVGAFALMGGHATFAPQFMVSIYKGLGSPLYTYAITGGGGILLVGLIVFAIYHNCSKPHHIIPKKVS